MQPDYQLMDLVEVSGSFPRLPLHQVEREPVLVTLEQLLQNNQVVVVEGPQGIGKTTVLAQFAKLHSRTTLSLFIKPTANYTVYPEILLLDLCNQFEWALHQREIDVEQVNASLLTKQVFSLRRKARSAKQIYYFVVDGLHHVPKTEQNVLDQILGLLPPFEDKDFRFLFSGDLKQLDLNRLAPHSSKSFPLTGFTYDETLRYFNDTQLTQNMVKRLHNTYHGHDLHPQT